MHRWPGATRSALLTFASAYVVLAVDFYLLGFPGLLQAIALGLAIALPALGAAYGIFFFHWLFESERSAAYADYGFGIWLISSLASLIYLAVFAGLGAFVPYAILRLELFGPLVQEFAARMTWASDYFEPAIGRNLALFVLLEIFACAYGKREGMRARRSEQASDGPSRGEGSA